MEIKNTIEKILRSRIFWGICIPILIIIITIIVGIINGSRAASQVRLDYLNTILLLIVFFPSYILINLKNQVGYFFIQNLTRSIILSLITYSAYILFIIKLKKLKLKYIYIISIIILILIILGIRGMIPFFPYTII